MARGGANKDTPRPFSFETGGGHTPLPLSLSCYTTLLLACSSAGCGERYRFCDFLRVHIFLVSIFILDVEQLLSHFVSLHLRRAVPRHYPD